MHECRERKEAQERPKQKARFLLCVLSSVNGASLHHSCSISQTPGYLRNVR